MMPALNIDPCYLNWILVFALGAVVLALSYYIYRLRAQVAKLRGAANGQQRVAGEQSKVGTIKRERDGGSKLGVVLRPFKALLGQGDDDEWASSKEAVVRMLEGLNERAKNAVKDTKVLSPQDELLKLAALDSAFKHYEEIIDGASDEQFKDVQFPLNAFAKTIEEKTLKLYGVQAHPPEFIRELIGFGEWCTQQNYTLEKIKKYSLMGDISFKSYLEVNRKESTEPPHDVETVCQFFAALPGRLKGLEQGIETLKEEVSAAKEAVDAERKHWSGFAERERTLTARIEDLGATVEAKERDIQSKDSKIGELNRQIINLTQEKNVTQNELNDAQAILNRLARVGQLTEKLTSGRQSLDNSLAKNEYRVYLAFLMYYSLLNLYAGIVSKDKQKEDLMRVNLYQMVHRCKRYKNRSISQFEEAHTAIVEGLAARNKGTKVERLKDEYASKANYEIHSDRNLFSLVFSALRENCDISLTPFFIDTQAGEPVGAN
jgi:DNA repair exonuclease SbcCD ATPase subunit